MYKELELNEIKALGWVKEYLKTQAEGMTGNLDKVGEPFSGDYWASADGNVQKEYRFLGGLDIPNDAWVAYEQTGYWIDGMVRIAHLLDDENLYKKAKSYIYPALLNADKDGYIGPKFLKDGLTWQHSVYLRSWFAEYSATKSAELLDGLKKHYRRAPLKDVYDKDDSSRIIKVRDVCDIEGALWLYGVTGEKDFLQMAEDSYKRFNKIYSKDNGVALHEKMRGLTLKGMISDLRADNNHGVTYCEVCKIPAILYLYTGKEIYKQASINAFDKLYRDQMIIDGVNSSTEYLNGNKDSRSAHETCDVADLTWALGYLFMITGDAKYGDKIENAIFNAGLGSIDDEFKEHQYFSCPNQVIADDTSNHATFYRGRDWMSYSPAMILGCCTGNVNRIMPNFVCRSWFKDGDELTALLYAPTVIQTQIGGQRVKITEDTAYPFENEIQFTITTEKKVNFALKLRLPGWTIDYKLTINGKPQKQKPENGFLIVNKTFSNGDIINLSFSDKIEYVYNAGGVSVKKGGLLYALAINEEKVIEEMPRGLGDKDYPHYSLYPTSKWNYGLNVSRQENAKFYSDTHTETPWKNGASGLSIEVAGVEIENWKIRNAERIRIKFNPRKRGRVFERKCQLTPKLLKRGTEILGEEKTIKLVPYCTTRLRIAIFSAIEK